MPVRCPSLLATGVAVQPKPFIFRGLRLVFDAALIFKRHFNFIFSKNQRLAFPAYLLALVPPILG